MYSFFKGQRVSIWFCAITILIELFDLSALNAILGHIINYFNINSNNVSWVFVSFSIGSCLAFPLGKYAYQNFPLRVFYRYMLIFLLLSLGICCFKISWEIFCIARAIQGLTITLLYTVSFTEVIATSDSKEREINLMSGIGVLGLVLGPTVGAIFSTWFSWKSIFGFLAFLSLILIYLNHKYKHVESDNKGESQQFVILEYVAFVITLTAFSLLIESKEFSIVYVVMFLGGLTYLIYTYAYLPTPFIFNREIFNRQLLLAISLNFWARLSLNTIPPLYSIALYQAYHYSVGSISIIFTIGGLFSIIAKWVYNRFKIARESYLLNVIPYLGFLFLMGMYFLFKVNNFGFFNFLFAIFGLASSLMFNFVNFSIYVGQKEELNQDISLMLNIVQMLFFGFCNYIVLSLFNFINKYFALNITMLIIMIIMIVATLFTIKIYNRINEL